MHLTTIFCILYFYLCILYFCTWKWFLWSSLPSQVSFLPLGILASGLNGRIWKPGQPGGDLPLSIITINSPNNTKVTTEIQQIQTNLEKCQKSLWQLLFLTKLCQNLLNVSKTTIKTLYLKLNCLKSDKTVQNSQVQSSLSKNKFKFEPVTGSKQKHMAISSIAGSTLSLQYPLFQGLLSKEQLN